LHQIGQDLARGRISCSGRSGRSRCKTAASPSSLERIVVEIEALSLKDQFWLMERVMQGIRSKTLQESPINTAVNVIESNSRLEDVDGLLVVKSQSSEILDLDLVEFINEQREERIRAVGGW
jgi:hypothetical protein